MTVDVKFKPLAAGCVMPTYATEGSAGADLYACVQGDAMCLKPGQHALIPLGFSVEIPRGYEIQVRPRSGLAAKHKITVLNSPGTIDSDYRGEMMVMLINHGEKPFYINHGDRIAQMVLAPVVQAAFAQVDELSETERGAGGFGSTGV